MTFSISYIEMAKVSASRNVRRSRNKRRSMRNKRTLRGGALVISPANINDSSMADASRQNLSQGMDYTRINAGQHGGASIMAGAPVGYTGVLDTALRASAHPSPLDASVAAASGMKDQAGGARSISKMFQNSFRNMRKSLSMKGVKKMMKGMTKRNAAKRNATKVASRKSKKGGKKQRGGAGYQYANQADYASPGALLPSDMQAKALTGMNPEWKIDQATYAPKQ